MLSLIYQLILVSICSKLQCLSTCKKSTEQTCYFRYFGHVWPHTPKTMYISISKNLQRLSGGKKSTSSFIFFLRCCKDIVNWLFLVFWACLATLTQSDTIILWKTFVFICRQKINFISYASMEILQRYANLFWLLWTCLFPVTQNDRIALPNISTFICMQKINFIIHFFLTILHFKEPCNLIGWQHFGP